MKKIIFLVCSVLFFYYVLYHRTVVQTPLDRDTLIVGTSADYPPYASVDLHTNQIVGFDIDIIQEIASRMNKKIELRDMPFNYLMFDLYCGHIDIIAAGLTPDEERKKAVLFSKPYLTSDPLVIVTRKDKPIIHDISDLYGKLVAVNTGYTSDLFLSKISEINLIRLKATADAIMALQANSIDAFATSQSSLKLFLSTQDENHEYQCFVMPATEDSYTLAYSYENLALKQRIDIIIDQMESDGTLQKIKQKWGFV